MSEIIVVFICFTFIFAAGYLGFVAGKNVAQREAAYTIAQLRRAVSITRKEVDDLRLRLNRLLKAGGK
jgi:hypothetical protein